MRGRAAWTGPLVVSIVAASTYLGVSSTASAGNGVVQGNQGLEIEGARDRRGFYIGGGLGFGGTFFWTNDFMPAMRTDLALGGGLTKRFTLGVDLHVTPYLMRHVGVTFGGDIEATGYLFRGLFLRAAAGAGGTPRRESTGDTKKGLTVGLGGAATLGYEFFLNASAALGVGLTYDARFVPGSKLPRQTLLIGVRFTWF